MLSETSGSYHKARNLSGLRSVLLCVFCLLMPNVADVIAFVSSVDMEVDLPGPPLFSCRQSSVTPNQHRINTPKIFLLLTNQSSLSEKPWKLHKSWSGMDLLRSNSKYTVDHGCISHTWKKNRVHAWGSVKRKWFNVAESMGTIHCQDALNSPHTNSCKHFHSLIELKPLKSNMLQRYKCHFCQLTLNCDDSQKHFFITAVAP